MHAMLDTLLIHLHFPHILTSILQFFRVNTMQRSYETKHVFGITFYFYFYFYFVVEVLKKIIL